MLLNADTEVNKTVVLSSTHIRFYESKVIKQYYFFLYNCEMPTPRIVIRIKTYEEP